MSSQIIEVVQNSPSWWQAWLPLLGSAIVALAAFTGVIVSNRTNRQAITAADDREWIKWQREQIISIAYEIITVAHKSGSRMRGWVLWTQEEKIRNLVEINNEMAAVPNLLRKLEMLVGGSLSTEGSAIYRALADAFTHMGEQPLTAEERKTALDEMESKASAVAVACREFAKAVRYRLESTTSPSDHPSAHRRFRVVPPGSGRVASD